MFVSNANFIHYVSRSTSARPLSLFDSLLLNKKRNKSKAKDKDQDIREDLTGGSSDDDDDDDEGEGSEERRVSTPPSETTTPRGEDPPTTPGIFSCSFLVQKHNYK